MIIIGIFALIQILILYIYIYKIKNMNYIKKYFIAIYMLWWIICTAIATTTYGNTFQISDSTINIFMISISFFMGGFILIDYIKNFRKKSDNESSIEISEKKKKMYRKIQMLTQIVLLIILVYYKIKQIQLVSIYGDENKRNFGFELGYLFNNAIEAGIFNYIINALVSFFNVIMVRDIIIKKFNITTILQFIITILIFSINYGRIIFFNLIIYAIFWIIVLHGKNMKEFIKTNTNLIIKVLLGGIIVLLIASFSRVGVNISDISSIKKAWDRTTNQVVIYFTGGIKAFEQATKQDYREQIISEYGNDTSGLATFTWVEQFLIQTNNEKSLNNIMGKLMQQEIKIGQYQDINAYFTCLFNFYIDFGYFGICFFQFLYGCAMSLIIDFYIKRKNLGRGIFLVLNLTFAIMGVTRWFYQSIGNIILLVLPILLSILLEKGNVKKNENNVVM